MEHEDVLSLSRALAVAVLLGAAAGCVGQPPDLPEADTLAGSDDGGELPDPDSGGPWEGSTGAADETGSDESGEPGLPPPFDDPAAEGGCDTYAQDCPAGEKCMPVGSEDTEGWEETACRPLMMQPGQVGDPCVISGADNSGHDSCAAGTMCWDVDPNTGAGTCIALCTGSAAAPSCDDPDAACVVDGSGALAACLPTCAPLDTAACPSGQGCYLVGEALACVPVASAGGAEAGDACETANGCEPGTICVDTHYVPGCDGAIGCCTDYCDTMNPSVCPTGTECFALYGETAPADLASVGICVATN